MKRKQIIYLCLVIAFLGFNLFRINYENMWSKENIAPIGIIICMVICGFILITELQKGEK